jgi:hypothetical protein
VEADGSQTFESNSLFTLPREVLEPYVGSKALPRDLVREETRTRSQVHIRPAGGLTWGEVVRPEQIVVDALWRARDYEPVSQRVWYEHPACSFGLWDRFLERVRTPRAKRGVRSRCLRTGF